jgi:predicted metal-dependent hydrolase
MLRVDAREVPVELALHPRARRITLRVDKARGTLRLTLPPGVSQSEGLRFAGRQQAWLRRRLSELPQAVPFAEGAEVPVLGEAHTIRHVPGARRGVWRAHGAIYVSGAGEHLPRRVRDYLKAEARREIAQRAAPLARQVGRPHGRITIRDTASRWGSCSAKGDLSFSWRLILAPERVLQYVVAHEVAHLRQMNHSPRFWALVDQLVDDAETPKAWLRHHGASLMRYG